MLKLQAQAYVKKTAVNKNNSQKNNVMNKKNQQNVAFGTKTESEIFEMLAIIAETQCMIGTSQSTTEKKIKNIEENIKEIKAALCEDQQVSEQNSEPPALMYT